MKKEDAPEYVYVVYWQVEGPCKIGLTTKPALRLSHLQTGNPNPLHMEEFSSCNATLAELTAHASLEELRLSGEWFDVSRDRAVLEVWRAIQKSRWLPHALEKVKQAMDEFYDADIDPTSERSALAALSSSVARAFGDGHKWDFHPDAAQDALAAWESASKKKDNEKTRKIIAEAKEHLPEPKDTGEVIRPKPVNVDPYKEE